MRTLKNTILFSMLLYAACQAQTPEERLIRTTMPAPSLGENLFGTHAEQPIIVYLPPSYTKSDKKYPVIYFLPGFTTDVTEMIDGTFQGLNIQTAMDDLIAAGSIREMIFVVANGRNFLGGSFYINSPVTGNWEDFIVKDVVRYVDSKYRTLVAGASRGISGSSMGGFGAIHLGMRHPDVFGAVYSLSPGLFDENGLRDQGMFVPEDKIFQVLAKQETFDAMPEEEARAEFKTFIAWLYGTRFPAQYFQAFSYAYGAAFSPNPQAGIPYIDYPYSRNDSTIVLDSSKMQNYINGFGGLAEKVRLYRDDLLRLKGLTIDIGANDFYRWIVNGSRYFAHLLEAAGIPHSLIEHDGNHEDRLRERVENHLLPFFSELLAKE